jgi:hypothetical protein
MPPKDCKNNKIAEHNWKQSCYGIVDVFVKLEKGERRCSRSYQTHSCSKQK